MYCQRNTKYRSFRLCAIRENKLVKLMHDFKSCQIGAEFAYSKALATLLSLILRGHLKSTDPLEEVSPIKSSSSVLKSRFLRQRKSLRQREMASGDDSFYNIVFSTKIQKLHFFLSCTHGFPSLFSFQLVLSSLQGCIL